MTTINLARLSQDDRATLEQLAADAGIDLSVTDEPDAGADGPDDAEPGGGEGEGSSTDDGDDGADLGDADADDIDAQLGITDDDLDALIDAELESLNIDPDLEDVSLSADDDGTDGLDDGDGHDDVDDVLGRRRDVDLSATDPDEASTLRAELAIRDYMAAGVPRYVLDLATPILAMGADDAIDLASPIDGTDVDVRGIVTGILDAIKGTVDLSAEQGYSHDGEDGSVSPTAARWLAHLDAAEL